MARTMLQQAHNSQEGDRQSLARTGKDQREIATVGVVLPPRTVEAFLVDSCTDPLMAVNRCIDLSKLADDELARQLGIDPGHFCRMRKGRAHFPTRKLIHLMELCGNLLPLQYLATKFDYQLLPSDRRIRELERLEEGRRRA